MKDKELIGLLHRVGVTPSQRLQKRIALVADHLPNNSHGARVPLIVFQTGLIVTTVLIFILSVGSGIVLAAQLSGPGSFLFPVKRAVIQAELHFTNNPLKKQKLQEQLNNVQLISTPIPLQVRKEERTTETPSVTQQDKHEDVQGSKTEKEAQPILTPVPQDNKNEVDKNKNNSLRQEGENFFRQGINFLFDSSPSNTPQKED